MEQIGKRGWDIGGALFRAGNGRLGGVVVDSAAWWVEGISGGVCEGVGEGIGILGMGRGRRQRGKGRG